MTEGSEIVVVGAGILGLCTAVELCRAGAGTVHVVERGDPGAGTTKAGAGFLDLWATTQAGAEEEVAVEEYGAEFYASLASRHDIGFAQRGNVWLALGEEAWEKKLRPLLEHPATAGAERLTPAEAAKLVAVLGPQGVFAAVYQPSGARLSTASAAEAIAEEIEESGGRISTDCEATGIEIAGGRVAGVTTPSGGIRADAVVIAAGAWTNLILDSIGLWVPMVPLAATRFLTGPAEIPAEMPSILVPEMNDLYVREHAGALSWGCLYDASPRHDFSSDPPPAEPSGPSPQGVDEMLAIAERIRTTIPALAELPRTASFTGFPVHTPDYRAVLGPVGGIEGLWLAAGDNYAGVTHGPGFGRLLADLMLGRPSVADSRSFSPERFADGSYASPADVLRAPLVKTAGWA
jgi:sarcosine oxidase subunit beta